MPKRNPVEASRGLGIGVESEIILPTLKGMGSVAFEINREFEQTGQAYLQSTIVPKDPCEQGTLMCEWLRRKGQKLSARDIDALADVVYLIRVLPSTVTI